MKITVIAVSSPALYHLANLRREFEENLAQNIDLRLLHISPSCVPFFLSRKEEILSSIEGSDFVVMDLMGSSPLLLEVFEEGLKKCTGHRLIIGNLCREYTKLGSFSMSMMKKRKSPEKDDIRLPQEEKRRKNDTSQAIKTMHRMRRIAMILGNIIPFGMAKDVKNTFRLIDYWQQGTEEDLRSFMRLILREYLGQRQVPKEKPSGIKYGIYLKHPLTGEVFESLSSYRKKHFARPKPLTVALLFYGHSYPNDFSPVTREVFARLEERYNVLPLAFSQNRDCDLDDLRSYLCDKEISLCAIVNLMPFRLGAGPMGGDAQRAVGILKDCNVPYFKPLIVTRADRTEWEERSSLDPGEFLISILLPELDGAIHTYPLGLSRRERIAEEEGLDISVTEPIKERISTFCRRLDRFVTLRTKADRDKKIALVCYNYPAGEGNLFSASFLDSFSSLANILKHLHKEGYQVKELSEEELRHFFTSDGMCNDPAWASSSPSPHTYEGVPIRGLLSGNVFIGIQPTKKQNQTGEEIHDRNLPPSKEYQSFYLWLEHEFQADAVIHVGTHGTLEFLPGKENAVSSDCWPDRLPGSLPHFYYYYIGNPSEAMIAKRRSNASLISYLPPVFRESELYGPYSDLKQLISEYREALQIAPERCNDLIADMEELSISLSFLKEGETLCSSMIDEIEEELYEYETSLIPDGLHILGEPYTREEAEAFAERVLSFLDKDDARYEEQKILLLHHCLNNRELQALTEALNAGYLPVGIAGDILKEPTLLPSGRNLVQFNPLHVPTRTAFERGKTIAENILRSYFDRHGAYPETTAVILWGLETSKTQGETLGQILYYLGARLKEGSSRFDNRFELLPPEELDRPRIDVVVHICGFFRDMFPNLLEDLNEVFRKLDELKEDPKNSSFAKNTERLYREKLEVGLSPELARELARSRIFGPREGEYGTSLTRRVKEGSWKDSEELGDFFADDLSYLYSSSRRAFPAKDILLSSYKGVELLSQVRNNVEYELTDLDHYYEFYGGLSKAVENSRGEQVDMYVADTVGGGIAVRDIKAALQRGIRLRLLNPQWIEGMMRHQYHGVQEIAKRFENVIGFASTTNSIDGRTFSDLQRRFVSDEDLRKRMQESNRWAYIQVLNRLAEAKNRGLWTPTDEEWTTLQEVYLETETGMEH
ncbi:MAG: cobaltochelatase subunit CobN [Filifactor alocis]|nr:cobaltochelatase subunit CobN [Filifactor alocis]